MPCRNATAKILDDNLYWICPVTRDECIECDDAGGLDDPGPLKNDEKYDSFYNGKE